MRQSGQMETKWLDRWGMQSKWVLSEGMVLEGCWLKKQRIALNTAYHWPAGKFGRYHSQVSDQ